MRVRDGPAAVRGDAPAPKSHWPRGREGGGEGAPSQKTCRVAAKPEPLAEGGFVSRAPHRSLRRSLACAAAVRRSPLRVHVRVEGKTQTIFGAAEPTLTRRRTRSTRSTRPASPASSTTTSQHRRFGPYVDQIGRYAAPARSGWVFKVNGVSPPVGADQVTLKDGDTRALVLGDVRPERRAADALLRSAHGATATASPPRTTRARRRPHAARGRSHVGRSVDRPRPARGLRRQASRRSSGRR